MNELPTRRGFLGGLAATFATATLAGTAEAQYSLPHRLRPPPLRHLDPMGPPRPSPLDAMPASQPVGDDLLHRLYLNTYDHFRHNRKERLSYREALETTARAGIAAPSQQREEAYLERKLDEAALPLLRDLNESHQMDKGVLTPQSQINAMLQRAVPVHAKLIDFLRVRDANVAEVALNMVRSDKGDLTREATMLTFASDLMEGGTMAGNALHLRPDPAGMLHSINQHYLGLQMGRAFAAAGVDYEIGWRDTINYDSRRRVMSFPASSLAYPDQLAHDFLAARNAAAWMVSGHKGWKYPAEDVDPYFRRPVMTYYSAGRIGPNEDYNRGLNYDPMFAWDVFKDRIVEDLTAKVAQPAPAMPETMRPRAPARAGKAPARKPAR